MVWVAKAVVFVGQTCEVWLALLSLMLALAAQDLERGSY